MNKIGGTLIHTGTNEELVVALIEHQVEFILIGGLAVSWFCSARVGRTRLVKAVRRISFETTP